MFTLTACGQKSLEKEEAEMSASMKDWNAHSVEAGTVDFTTTDIEGNLFQNEDIKNAKLVMVNFWEPWCGPCVGEMPDLEALYETYQEEGLLILGVFSSTDKMDESKELLAEMGITYPILLCSDALAEYATKYVPTTFFTDGEGHILTNEPLIGAYSYEEWETMITEYLE